MPEQRRCPFCEETVIGDATICHYCGRELPGEDAGGGGRAGSLGRTALSLLVVVLVALAVVVLVFALRTWMARADLAFDTAGAVAHLRAML